MSSTERFRGDDEGRGVVTDSRDFAAWPPSFNEALFTPFLGSLHAPAPAPGVTSWSLVSLCGLRCFVRGSAAPARRYQNFDGGGPLAANASGRKSHLVSSQSKAPFLSLSLSRALACKCIDGASRILQISNDRPGSLSRGGIEARRKRQVLSFFYERGGKQLWRKKLRARRLFFPFSFNLFPSPLKRLSTGELHGSRNLSCHVAHRCYCLLFLSLSKGNRQEIKLHAKKLPTFRP